FRFGPAVLGGCMSEVWINDVDLADYGFVLGQPATGHADTPAFADALGTMIGAVGAQWLGEPVQVGPRRLTVGRQILPPSAASLRAAVDSSKMLASGGAVRIRFADRPDQEFRDCRLLSAQANPRGAILSNLAGDIVLLFEAANPLRYDVNPQGISLSTSRAP